MNKTHLGNETSDTPSIHNSNIIAPALLNFFSWLTCLNSFIICSTLSHFIFFFSSGMLYPQPHPLQKKFSYFN